MKLNFVVNVGRVYFSYDKLFQLLQQTFDMILLLENSRFQELFYIEFARSSLCSLFNSLSFSNLSPISPLSLSPFPASAA